MHLDKALGILDRNCTSNLEKDALARVRKSIAEKNRKNKELLGINDFLEEYVSKTTSNQC